MSWAARRRSLYVLGVVLFFLVIVGGPLVYKLASRPATCTDGIQNQRETAVDKGGPCPRLDESRLVPSNVLWTRGFRVRSDSYNAVALIQNPNGEAGARAVPYTFGLYDERNLLIAERSGTTFIMPGGVTPIFEGAIDTGNRIVAHTYFDLNAEPQWERMQDTSVALIISNIESADTTTMPRVSAEVRNTSVEDYGETVFIAIVYDTAGNAFAASQTALPQVAAGETAQLVFTWPAPFSTSVGRIQITALSAPEPVF